MKGSEDVATHFAANLRRVRKAADLSQEEVGRRSSLHRTEVGLLERGARVPKVDTLVKLASALDVAPARLLEGIDWIPGEPGEPKPGKFKHHSDQDPAQTDQGENKSKKSEARDPSEEEKGRRQS